MLITKKMLLGLALAVALVGAGVGALVTHSASNPNPMATNTTAEANPDANPVVNQTAKTPDQMAAENSTQFRTSEEQPVFPVFQRATGLLRLQQRAAWSKLLAETPR